MKKFIAAASAAALMAVIPGSAVFAAGSEADSVTVNVTVSDDKGNLCLAETPVKVTDTDGDGLLTVNDALSTAHELHYNGGAENGYKASEGQYGLFLEKLWGIQNGGSYGYYVNDVASSSLSDTVKDGDFVNAFVYQDTTTWSDKYTYFDKKNAEAEDFRDGITLTLYAVEFDASWQPVAVPLKDAEIVITRYNVTGSSGFPSGANPTGLKTDADGKVNVVFDAPGTFYISALTESTTVPPVCRVNAGQSHEPYVTYWGLNLPEPYVTSETTSSQGNSVTEVTEEQQITETSASESAAAQTEPAAVSYAESGTSAAESSASVSVSSVSAVASTPATGDSGYSGLVIAFLASGAAVLAASGRRHEK